MQIAEALDLRPHQLLEMGESIMSGDYGPPSKSSPSPELQTTWFHSPSAAPAPSHQAEKMLLASVAMPTASTSELVLEDRPTDSFEPRAELHALIDELTEEDVEVALQLVRRLAGSG